ncbi:MAG: hypothetical protein IPM94_16845 [bacterium]|nr:hypothetical protein [bacterium]
MRATCAILAALLLAAAPAAADGVPEGLWTARGQETYLLRGGESVQFRIEYAQIPVRAWRLTVDGDQLLCHVNVLRLADGSLLYQQNGESHHEVRVPWGRDEAIAVTITADLSGGGVFTVKLLGPPPDETRQAYGYAMNRGLEALEAGDDERAAALFEDAARQGEDGAVAELMLAGLAKKRGAAEDAAAHLDRALGYRLPPELADVERELRRQLDVVRVHGSPLLADTDAMLAAGDTTRAERFCRRALAAPDATAWSISEAQRRLGWILQARGDLYGALEAFDAAVRGAADRGQKALGAFALARLHLALANPDQARAALRLARELGLPGDLDREAEALLRQPDTEGGP